jgi:hydroxymethylglutaryl-CoA lyase
VFTTEQKLELLTALAAAGLDRIEVTSFVPAKYMPQFYDAEDLLAAFRPRTRAELIAFVPNSHGMERAAAAAREGKGPDTALIVVSASEAHNQKNLKRTVAETMADHAKAARIARAAGIKLLGSISTAFGCPYSGDVPVDNVLRLVRHYRDIGADEIQFGDTTGTANPLGVRRFFARVLPELGGLTPVAHFHDTRGAAIANSLAAIDAGVTVIDTALGGTGGRPTNQRIQRSGPTGNTSTEDLAALLAEMGIETGIDVDALLEAGRRLQTMLGHDLFSHIQHAGRVLHTGATPSATARQPVAA